MFYFSFDLDVFQFKLFLIKKVTSALRHNTVASIFLCQALNCVQHNPVSSTFLFQTKYGVRAYPKMHLFTFHISMCCGRITLRLQSTSVKRYIYKIMFPGAYFIKHSQNNMRLKKHFVIWFDQNLRKRLFSKMVSSVIVMFKSDKKWKMNNLK